jgi:hypothetical protein
MELDRAHRERGSFKKRIWKLIAFLARYGNQPADVSLRLPVDSLQALAGCVGDLLEREAEASRTKE